MIFFGRKSSKGDDEDDDEGDDDEERELCSFQGALNGKDVDLKANARLAQAGLVPAKEVVTDAIERRAESIRLELKGERALTTFYIDGVAFSGGKMARPQALAVMQMLKLLAGLDVKLKGQTQHGGVKAEFQGIPWEVTVDAAPLPDGAERFTLRLRNLKDKRTTLEELGFPASVKAMVRDLTSKKRGVVLVSGAGGTGVTSTVYAFLKGIDLYMYSAFTTVKMGSREVYNVQQFEANEGDTYQHTMERMIRSEADVIFVDPIRDADMAQAVVNVADRVCILGELPAKDASTAIQQFAKWVGDPQKAAAVLGAAFSVRLIRTLCPKCKEAFRPNPKLLAKVGLPPETKILYRKPEPEPDPKTGELPDPCEHCADVGYIGRAPMLEVILASETVTKLIAGGALPDQVKAQARAEGMLTFHKDGLRVVAEGKTSLEELQRIFKSPS